MDPRPKPRGFDPLEFLSGYFDTVEINSTLAFARAVAAGARALSPATLRDWGDVAAYVMDLDGHVVAFARCAEGGG